MKIAKALKTVSLYIIAFSLLLIPQLKPVQTGATSMTLIPPLCFVKEAYGSTNTDPQRIINDKNVKIEVRFKIFDLIASLFK